ncbi:MAG: hypothetical protein HND54_06215 [Bacteroidetes bacterium]|nr:hypothetical protein [Bacteroidota bacterium]
MKKLITLSFIFLLGITVMAQPNNKKDHMVQKFNEIKSELNLTEKQELAIKQLIEKRKQDMSKEQEERVLSDAAMKKEKMENMKKRQESNESFKKGISEILTEEQNAKLKELMPERQQKMQHEQMRDSKLQHDHQHKMGEDHDH